MCRRAVWSVVIAALIVASAAPAGALTRVPFEAPAQAYQLVDVCTFVIDAQERDPHRGFQVYDGKDLVAVTLQDAFTTVLSSSLGVLDFDSIGTTTVTANGDGTWTMVQKGTGLAIVPRSDPDGPRLVWFSGRVVSVGAFDPKTLRFDPISQVRSGIESNVCTMLATGLKTRHDI